MEKTEILNKLGQITVPLSATYEFDDEKLTKISVHRGSLPMYLIIEKLLHNNGLPAVLKEEFEQADAA